MPEKKSKKNETGEEKGEDISMEKSLESSKEMGSELQNFIGALSQGKGSYHRKRREEGAKKKERRKKEEKKKEEKTASESDSSESKISKPEVSEPKAPQLSPDSEQSKQIAEDYVKEETMKSVKEKPSFMDKEEPVEEKEEKTIYKKLEEFIVKFFEGNKKKYDEWESSINSFVSVLRKMRKITKNNTKRLLNEIDKMEEHYKAQLEQFRVKRDAIEKMADIDMDEMSEQFNKVTGLMDIQLKDYRLKRLVEDIYF